MATAAPTRTEQVYARMRPDILGGHLTPGAKLPFAELVARYGGSTSVIREGLTDWSNRASCRRAATRLPRRSASISDLDDLTRRGASSKGCPAAVDRRR